MADGIDVDKARSCFPALANGYIYADNAGGSQCCRDVVERVTDYLLNTNVQLGADYSTSVTSTSRVAEGPKVTAELINAESPDEIAFASSSTMAVENLARALDKDILDDEEIIITGEHESNASPWKRLAARRGLILKTWGHSPISSEANNPYAVQLSLDALLPLITPKTRLVAFTACSNILGQIIDIASVTRAIKEEAANKGVRKVEVCVDCVAYAPHRRIDVRGWDVEYCYFSYYKVYGPHVAVLYTRLSSINSSLSSLAHHFLRIDSSAYKICPGGMGYELTYAVSGVLPYLQSLSPRGDINDAFARIAAHEQALLRPLLGYLTSEEGKARGIFIVGSSKLDLERVPTVSFVVVGNRPLRSKDIVGYFDKGQMGIRYGHFYAYTLIDTLQPTVDINDAVVRISLVHYNTVTEVEKLVQVLKEALDALQ